MYGISQVLYGNSSKFKDAFEMDLQTNLLDIPKKCCLVFENNVLIVIGDEQQKNFCHLATGYIMDYKTLFKIHKNKDQKKLLEEINSIKQQLEEKILEYEELEKMTS